MHRDLSVCALGSLHALPRNGQGVVGRVNSNALRDAVLLCPPNPSTWLALAGLFCSVVLLDH